MIPQINQSNLKAQESNIIKVKKKDNYEKDDSFIANSKAYFDQYLK